ncbi:porin family protein [Acinetobacter baumannii]|uniref:porin family protein n=1 Tax=Acinetobacter baumannii TaxID=470 RepID=UPI001D172AE9|nr:porin family protein [Acinetobacter baumannii]
MVSLLGTVAATTANAGSTTIQPYVSAGYTFLNNDDVDVHFLGLNGGLQFNEYVGAEVFWNKSVNDIKFDGDLEELGVRTVIYAELSGDFPLGDSRQPIYKSLRPFDLVS